MPELYIFVWIVYPTLDLQLKICVYAQKLNNEQQPVTFTSAWRSTTTLLIR